MLSDFEVVAKILGDGKPKIAREVAKLARDLGLDWSRENANSAMYKMLRRNLIVKIETEKAPLWTLPEYAKDLPKAPEVKKPFVISFKQKAVPLSADNELTIKVKDIEIQFQFDSNLSPNAPYMSGDWLDEIIFITLNPNHPYWQTFVHDDERKGIFLTNIASEAYVQWHVAKMTSPVTPWKLLELRDQALRDISLSANSAE
jgi:hypothetical protein